MAIEMLDAASSVSGGATRNTVTWQHTVSGTQRLLLVGVAMSANPVDTDASATFNGDAMLEVGVFRQFTSNMHAVQLFYLVNPDVGTSLDIVVTGTAGYTSVAGGAISLTGVDQTTPLGTSNGAAVTTGSLETTVTSATGEWVVDVAACTYGTLLTADASQTGRWETYYGDTGDAEASKRRIGMSTKPGAASITMVWTGQNSDGAAIIAVPVKPAAATSVTWLRHRA